MPETKPDTPLDLSLFDNLDTPPNAVPAVIPQAGTSVVVADPRLQPEPPPERLVEVANLSPEDLAAAQQSAARIDFRKSTSLLTHGDGVLAGIAQASRQLLTGVRLGDAGEVGRIAAAVIDGVKILRIRICRPNRRATIRRRARASSASSSASPPMRIPRSRVSRKTARPSST